MVKIRLKRMGAKKQPFYRIVVSDVNTARDGQGIAEIGYYDAVKNPAVIKVDHDAPLEWLKKGAQPTGTVKNILSNEGIMSKFHDAKYKK